jgi:hypothetical protein
MEPTTKEPVASVDEKIAQLEQATNKELAGEVKPEAQKAEEVVVEAPEEGQAFKELQEKKGFKSTEDLARAYKALESRSTKAEQSNRALEEQLSSVQKMREAGQLSSEQDQALQVLESTIEKVLSKRLRPIEDSIGIQKVDRMITDFQTQRPDFKGAIVDEVLDYMVDHKGISMEDAYKIKAFDSVSTSAKKSEAVRTRETEVSKAFVESANTAKSGKEIDYSKLSLE